MGVINLGKKFEDRFKRDWKNSFPGKFIYRIPDQMNGHKETSQNPCDFLAMASQKLFMIECKETKENTLNFAKIPQLDRLKDYIGIEDTYQYIIIWYSLKDKVVAISAEEALRIRDKEGKKSINIKMLEDKSYNIIDIPSTKLRVFMETDYTYFVKKVRGEI